MSVPRRIKFTIESELESVPLVGTAINKICSIIPLSEVESYQAELCVVEACNNAIKHAYGNEPGHEVEVEVLLYADKVVFDICDTGKTMEGELRRTLNFNPDDLAQVPEGGMGLFIIHDIMDKVTYQHRDGHNVLRMVKHFTPKSRKER
ncbi:MAG: ATP-binding protein [Calditrichaeota bacterium]|nr:MAG: ATP-binding protein [Calditrichota bacterium]